MIDVPTAWSAALLRAPGEPLDRVEVRRPSLQAGQVLVAIHYSGVCRSQLMEVRGLRGDDPWLPHLLGHEGVGTVVEVGQGVQKVVPGDRVIVGWIRGDGMEAASPRLFTQEGERIFAGAATTFSQFTVASENRVYLKPSILSDKEAVLFGCALLTGGGIVMNEVQPRPGESLLINGLGGIGLSALIVALGLGANILVADPSEEKLTLALELGAEYAFDPSWGRLKEEIREYLPDGVDCAVEASGTALGIEEAFACLGKTGRLVFASHPPFGELVKLDPHGLISGKRIAGSWGGGCQPDRDVPRFADAVKAAGVDLEFMTPREYLLEDINEALDDLDSGVAIRPLLRM